MSAKKPTVIELFAGAGGMAIGLEKAGFETKLLVDIDKDCVATLKKNRPKWNVVQGDIQKIDFKGIEHELLCYVSGKMRTNYIQLEKGDLVRAEVSLYDIDKGRITYRVAKKHQRGEQQAQSA